MKNVHLPIDFGVITALPVERDAIIDLLENREMVQDACNDIRTYYVGDLRLRSGLSYKIVCVMTLDVGNVDAVMAAADLIRCWGPQHVAMIGIAGGVPRDGLTLGDVVVADEVIEYEYSKDGPGRPQLRPRAHRVDAPLLERAKVLTNWPGQVLAARPKGSLRSSSKLFIGPIASGNKVIAGRRARARIVSLNPRILAFEMESEGVATAAWQQLRSTPIMVIRGICDLADETKADDWQPYAARAAATFFRDFLLSAPLPSAQPGKGSLHEDNSDIHYAEMTSFIGRKSEIAAVSTLLVAEQPGFVTVTGTGGIGKTRLAVCVAERLAETFQDGVRFLALADIQKPELIAEELARKLGIQEAATPPIESLKGYLGRKRMLLVLDNFEKVISARSLITELATSCPTLKILVTSRALLRVPGERPFRVPALDLLPSHSWSSVAELSECAAIRLFTERAHDLTGTFVMNAENADAVAQICHRLEGIPLAIELAAARTQTLSPKAILARLGNQLDLLTRGRFLPARHRTMRSTIAWSYDLLDTKEKQLFRRLAVFVGGFTLGAAEALCREDGGSNLAVLDILSSLVENSLLSIPLKGPEPRFLMLETIKEFALERLTRVRKAESMKRAHATVFIRLVEEAEPELVGANQSKWLDRLEVERGNLQAALQWSSDTGDVDIGLRLASIPWRFWEVNGPLSEGRRWLNELLARVPKHGLSDDVLANGLYAAGVLAHIQNDCGAARTLLEQGLTLYKAIKNQQRIGDVLNELGLVAHDQGDDVSALTLLEEGLALCRGIGHKHGIAYSLGNLGLVALDRGDDERAIAFLETSASMRYELNDKLGTAAALNNVGLVALRQGDHERASDKFNQALTLFRGNQLGTAISLNNLGEVAQSQGDLESALDLYTKSLSIFQDVGDRRSTAFLLYHLGDLACGKGEYKQAKSLYADSLRLSEEVGARSTIALCLEGLAELALADGQPDAAARFLGAADGLREAINFPLDPVHRAHHERIVSQVRAALGEKAFSTAWLAGRSLTPDSVFAFAIEWITNTL
jgi:predicted ATPase/nucleoside phosphorylase